MDPWTVELLVVRRATSETERRVLAGDCARGLLHRARPGVYVERAAFESMTPEQQHIVSIRAYAAVAQAPPVFSHWSAAVLLGVPVLRARLDRVHVAFETPDGRSIRGVAAHVMPVLADVAVVTNGELLATNVPRTVVDIARASPFEEGVIAADGALHAGTARDLLEQAVVDAAGRRGRRRAQDVVAFAREEAESAAESRSRATMFRIGIAPPQLQVRIFDREGFAGRLDFGFPAVRAGGEVDGERKYRELARGGAAEAVIDEKRREDRVRRRLAALARWGWRESGAAALLAPILRSAGVLPVLPRSVLADWCTRFLTVRL